MFTQLHESLETDRQDAELAQDELTLHVEDTDIDHEVGELWLKEQVDELSEVSHGIDEEFNVPNTRAQQIAEASFFFTESTEEEEKIEDELADGTITTGDGEDISDLDEDETPAKVSKKEADNVENEIDKIGEELSHDGEPTE